MLVGQTGGVGIGILEALNTIILAGMFGKQVILSASMYKYIELFFNSGRQVSKLFWILIKYKLSVKAGKLNKRLFFRYTIESDAGKDGKLESWLVSATKVLRLVGNVGSVMSELNPQSISFKPEGNAGRVVS